MSTIRELREARGFTQRQLANRLQVSPHTVYRWEHGQQDPSPAKLAELARVFGVSPDEIVFGQSHGAGP